MAGVHSARQHDCIDTQANGFHGTFAGADQFCTYNGRFGGPRDVVGN